MSNDEEQHEEVMQKQESDENDVERLVGKKEKNEVLEENNSDERLQLFGIPIDEQTYKVSQGPRRRGGCRNNKRTHRYGTIWLQQQKMPTVREKIIKKMKTEARTKDKEEKSGKDKEKEVKFVDGFETKAEEI